MISKEIIVNLENGLHARPAGALVKLVKNFDCKVTVNSESITFDAKSILGVMSACIRNGSKIEIVCNGNEENECMDAIVKGFEEKFGE